MLNNRGNMVTKTFNVTEDVYREFSSYCKEFGLSMSKQVDMFMKSQIEEEPKVRKEYIRRLEAIQKGRFTKLKGSLMDNF